MLTLQALWEQRESFRHPLLQSHRPLAVLSPAGQGSAGCAVWVPMGTAHRPPSCPSPAARLLQVLHLSLPSSAPLPSHSTPPQISVRPKPLGFWAALCLLLLCTGLYFTITETSSVCALLQRGAALTEELRTNQISPNTQPTNRVHRQRWHHALRRMRLEISGFNGFL